MSGQFDTAVPTGSRGALSGVRVVETGGSRGELCGRLLADLGADVVKVEPPEGSFSRRHPPLAPFLGDEQSLSYLWFNANKRSVTADLTTEVGCGRVERLLRHADVLIDGSDVDEAIGKRVDLRIARETNPRLIHCAITGFGLDGPYAGFAAPDIVATAMSGLLSICGEPDRPPLHWPYDFGNQMASVTAAFGVLAALRVQRATGLGQLVEVTVQEVLAGIQHLLANYSVNSDILRRTGTRSPVGGLAAPQGAYRCLDGYVYMSVIWTSHWKALVEWMGKPEALADEIFEVRHIRSENREFIDSFVEPFIASKNKQELFLEGQRFGTFIAPINTVSEFVHDEHVEARRFFSAPGDPSFGGLKFPGMPFQMSLTPSTYRTGAPRLGQHDDDIDAELAELDSRAPESLGARLSAPPFAGIRVLDFTHAVAGPTLTRLLAELGAEVIKVESVRHSQRGTVPRDRERQYRQQIATFTDLNRNKLSMSLDMSTQLGRNVARRLVSRCDVVVNNFTPRVMKSWGLDHERLLEMRRDLIAVDMPGYGLDGPYRDFLAGAVIVQGISGAFNLWDYRSGGAPAAPPSWYADYGAGALAACAIAAAIVHRDRTGEGQHIEQSQLEATAWFNGPAYLEYLVTGSSCGANGVYRDDVAPYGPFRCLGEDRWCVIAVETDEQWDRLVAAMGSPSWATSEKLRHATGRASDRDALVERLGGWTATQTPHQVMRRLQAVGVPAGVVMTPEDLYLDTHLRARGFLTPLDDPAIGRHDYPGLSLRLSATPGSVGVASRFGEHTAYVLTEVLGMDQAEFSALCESGVLA